MFSLFQPNQVQLFREAFSLIDHDADGVVTEQDLKHIFASLGMNLLVPFLDPFGSALSRTDTQTFRPFISCRDQCLKTTDRGSSQRSTGGPQQESVC